MLPTKLLPVTVTTVPTAPKAGERAIVSGVTENAADAITLETPNAKTSTKYPPPTTSGTVTVVPAGSAPPVVEVSGREAPEQLLEEVLKQ